MATKKRLIDATPIIDECRECMNIEWNKSVYATWAEAEEDFMNRLLDAPTVDAVEVVRCKDCKNRGDVVSCPMCYEEEYEIDEGDGYSFYDYFTHDRTIDDGFCDRGERRTDNERKAD